MAWQHYITRRNTILFGIAGLASTYAAVRHRMDSEEEKQRKESYYVSPSRSGGGV